MVLRLTEWAIILIVCAFGIQCAYSFIQNMREIEQNCARDGGYCINTIPPPPPRQRAQGRGAAAGRMGTRTRKGQRPDPRSLGAQNERLPSSSQAAQTPAVDVGVGAPAGGAGTNPANQNNGLFGTSPNDPFGSLFPFMMFTRKRRQAMMDPGEAAEQPRIRRGESLYQFLNAHCRKSEFDFGCRNTGGMCCLPFLK